MGLSDPAPQAPSEPIAPGKSPALPEISIGGGGPVSPLPYLRPGATLGRFVVRAELGRGGMGVVYAADDATLGREVALKVLQIPDADEPRHRFLREARSAAALTDPGIATVYDVGEDAGRFFIAMELVRGRTLRALIEARPEGDRALPVAESLRIGREVARALGSAHARGVVHRDLKPENVMIAEAGLVKILDFGLAKRSDPTLSSDGTASTADGRILGTPSYMSPEQTKGRAVDARSDVFSLGVMLYEMATGRRPFDRPTVVEMFVAIDRDEPAPPSRQNARVPAALERVVLRCLRKDPAARYADARAVLRDLETVGAAPPARPFRAALGVAAAVAVAGLVALAASRPPASVPGAPAATPTGSAVAGAAAPTPITALPVPTVGKPEAIAAYRKAVEDFRNGDGWGAGFEQALELDPSLAAAHLRLSTITMGESVPSAREHFRKADELRSTLSERDRGMLDAIEPVVRRQPADWAESNRRLAALLARYPGDAELWYFLGCGTANYSDFEDGSRFYGKAVAIDPGFARAYAGMAMDQAYLGHFDESRRIVDRCLAVSPTAHPCLNLLSHIQSAAGECEAMEATARRQLASGTHAVGGYWALASSLVAVGQPVSTVREAVRQLGEARDADRTIKTEDRERYAAQDALVLGILEGDFEAAEKAVRVLEKLVAGSRRQDDHGRVALQLARILAEEGRDKDAAAVALDFLDRRDAWEPNPGAEDVAFGADATPSLLVFAERGGRLSRADAAARRASWLKVWMGKLTPVSKNFTWLHGYARAVDDADDARAALAALPTYEPLPPFRPTTAVDVDVGRTFLLGGRPDDALAWLERYTKSCSAFEAPMPHVHASLWLGRTREAKGDTKGACQAYQAVLDRWGKARPKSVTADAARDRQRALHCGV